MDLGISGRSAILLASSRGLGRACADSLAREGVHVVINGRTEADVLQACEELSTAHGIRATPVVGDATTTEVHDALLAACPEPDIVLLNGEGPPPTAFGDIDAAKWADTLQRTMVSPLLFVQRVLPGMQARTFGRIVAISSAMVKSPNPLMSMSHGPRLGLTGVLKGEAFFNIAQYPKATVESVKIQKEGDRYIADVAWTMKGKTVGYQIPLELQAKGSELRASGEVFIDRNQWGIGYAEYEGVTILPDVRVKLDIVAKKK